MATVKLWSILKVFLAQCLAFTTLSMHVHEFEMKQQDFTNLLEPQIAIRSRRDLADQRCQSQEKNFLKDVNSGNVKLEQKHAFQNESYYSMALAWCGNNGDLIVVITQESFGTVMPSKVYKSTDFGAHFTPVKLNKQPKIYKHNGVHRNPHNTKKIYLVDAGDPTGSHLFITEDGGNSFYESPLPFQLTGEILFHPNKAHEDYLLASSALLSTKIKSGNKNLMTLYASFDNGRTWRMVDTYVQTYKWGSLDDDPRTIYATVDPQKTHPFLATFVAIRYILHRYPDGTASSKTKILENVFSFGHQEKFLYASIYSPQVRGNRLIKISTNQGKTWHTAQLPTITGDRFFSVLDMNEKLVFMHVDNPGDTGHGTLYTSGALGVVYSESLPKHLYPNYGDVTDFYRVESMRGVYITSQINEDNSIHSMISYNRGATWQKLPRPNNAPCKDEKKPCHLQIHGTYSIQRGVIASPPLSTKAAPGIVLVHGHVADALQTTHPDVYVTSDGGYTWAKALDGPHQYQIADSGGLLVAVSVDSPQPTTIKFSVDEGQCWHEYKFVQNKDEEIVMTGLLTEPGNQALSVGVWGYHPKNKTWTAFIIDFSKVIKTQCGSDDYEKWIPHVKLRANEEAGVKGCLLGMREEFKRIRKDSWCHNGYNYTIEKKATKCVCTREDYECDYGYLRDTGSDICKKDQLFVKPEIDICLRGHEEKIITEGYRKIPGDVCVGGFLPSGRQIDLSVQCSENSKELVLEEITYKKQTGGHNSSVIAVVVIMVVLLLVIMSVFLVHKYIILRRHRVVYRYSLLNQNDAEQYDNEFETAISTTSATVYHDSDDDEELNSPAVKKDKNMYGSTAGSRTSSNHTRVKSYHDDSDVDMLE
ncbi:sortilin-like isoform X1 [Saccostrea echinata]|uniref:sortilin-like isoform X1 n=1 Tax=Saccostrea echinata TaxID=191078 RepID=UPI002A814438|nr:sortilin-like isoform X1 [Saccostrea echinata]